MIRRRGESGSGISMLVARHDDDDDDDSDLVFFSFLPAPFYCRVILFIREELSPLTIRKVYLYWTDENKIQTPL